MSTYQAKPLSIDLGPTDATDSMGRTAIIYGDSTAGKSTQLAAAAEYLATKHGKPVRLISAEDSSKTTFIPLIHAGLVDALFLTKIADPIGTLRKLSKGEWIKDGQWFMTDRGSACAYIIEGLASFADQIQEYNREHKLFLGEQGNQAHTTASNEVIALPGQFSYNATQMEMMRAIRAFGSIPGLDRVLWSSHEGKGTQVTNVVKDDKGRDQAAGQQIRGPLVCGAASTANVMKYCGLLLHLDMLTSNTGVVTRRLHLVTHADPKVLSVSSPAKVTVPLQAQEQFFKILGAQSGYIDTVVKEGVLVNSLADVLKAEDTVMEQLINKYKGVKNESV